MITYNKTILYTSSFSAIAIILSISACSSGELTPAGFGQSTERTITRGSISKTEPLTVSGRVFSSVDANIIASDQSAEQDSLQTGMQVTVESVAGSAALIHYEEDVKGPIDVVNIDNTLVVMGQSVVLSSNTVIDDSINATFLTGDIVEISGIRDANGVIQATFVEEKPNTVNSYNVRGVVSQLNATNQTFRIGSLLIDYSTARFDGLAQSSLSNGDFLEVKDENKRYEPGSFYLEATKVERYNDVFDTPGQVYQTSSSVASNQRTEVEIEAYVASFLSDDRFLLGATVVRIMPSTRFRDGQRENLQVNSRIEVEGRLNNSGELEAWEIEFEDGSDYYDSDDDDIFSESNATGTGGDIEVEIEGRVTNVDIADGSFLVDGILIRVGSSTEFEDQQDRTINRIEFFNLLIEGVTVVKVEWRQFTGYDEIPHEVEIEV